ncbi:hypothetical protein, partial [Streptococcus pneumoniae]|uniref:hypothetical protein n=1 Tax=Streptococcus pneumoniae TaxID=1313 RepID=UPI0018B0E293
IETAANKSAGNAAAAFDKGTSRIGQSVSKLGNALGNFGVPFSNALTGVGASFDKATTKGQNFGNTISKIGGVELLAAGAGIA